MIKDQKDLLIETDMLKGNINRICVTDDNEELEDMYKYAKIRLEDIYEYNKNRIFGNSTLEII